MSQVEVRILRRGEARSSSLCRIFRTLVVPELKLVRLKIVCHTSTFPLPGLPSLPTGVRLLVWRERGPEWDDPKLPGQSYGVIAPCMPLDSVPSIGNTLADTAAALIPTAVDDDQHGRMVSFSWTYLKDRTTVTRHKILWLT